ncbi:hypothetical protein NAT51_08545 [Flavobacterium amniphilum]|uniref:hypothetical protein n=1 Tax=Flavobacterium amniphilum TaxID=1834035 RepID=UPI002029F35D|nr:hypothetical protein [Flavobacterium amniphilum]MCL9805569.1 hypothetical protein [Flavobacterium amniphilum]
MIDINNFKENFQLEALPVTLEKLIHFQNNTSSFECYSQGFGVYIDSWYGLETWSNEEAFLDKLYPIAQANGSGSFYTIWDDGSGKELDQMPIAVFGDEGGVHIVAENLLQLLHLLTFDTEISVDFDEVYFYKDEEDYEESEDLNEFLEWLKTDYNLEQINNPDAIIESAQLKYKDAFANWSKQYYTD